MRNLQEERTIYEGTFTQDSYDCNIDDGTNDNFFPQINHETERGPTDRREIFQREINQIYGILNSLNDEKFDNEFLSTLQGYINKGRTLLRTKNKNSVKLTGVVNIMSEAKKNSVRRSFQSRDC